MELVLCSSLCALLYPAFFWPDFGLVTISCVYNGFALRARLEVRDEILELVERSRRVFHIRDDIFSFRVGTVRVFTVFIATFIVLLFKVNVSKSDGLLSLCRSFFIGLRTVLERQ